MLLYSKVKSQADYVISDSPCLPARALWDGNILRQGAKRCLGSEDPGHKAVAERLERLYAKAQSAAITHPVEEPFFPIDKDLIANFRTDDPAEYWHATLADHHGEQNAIPLPAYIYQEQDWDTFITAFTQIREAFTIAMETTVAGFAFEDDDLLEKGLLVWRDLVAWKPGGFCDDWHGDMISITMTSCLVRVAIWQKDRLTKEDWKNLGAMLEWRIKAAHDLMEHFAIDRFPHDSHVIQAAALFAATVMAAEPYFPSMKPYRDWICEKIEPLFPVWGGADGGWAAGPNYWKWSAMDWLRIFDLYPEDHPSRSHPWVENTGWYKMYCQPPYSRQGAFGDHCDTPPSNLDSSLLRYLGALTKRPELIWYADEVLANDHGVRDPGPVFVEVEALTFDLAALSTTISGVAPSSDSSTRHFEDSGIIAAHTSLGDRNRNIMLLFRSSRWGSFNHAHADQNAFVLEAWGEPLLIDAGYYPLYHHAHMKKFTIQTMAHNAILVDGVGQTTRNLHSRGRISHYQNGGASVSFSGDATAAYSGRCKRVLRHVWFEMEAEIPFFIVMDEVETVHPHVIDWLLHSYEEMEIDEVCNTVLATGWRKYGGTSRALTHLLTPTDFYWKQTDDFPAPADLRELDKPKQWHLQVTPKNYSNRSLIIATIQIGTASTAWNQPIYDFKTNRVTVNDRSFECRPNVGIRSLGCMAAVSSVSG